jgi:3-(3-hydroxy-phenyl)propionate hydroxylase
VQAASDWLSSCGLVCRSLAIVAQDDDFLMPQSELHWPDGGLRDSEGQLELLLRSAGAQAVVLRPDRYVLGYIDSRDGQSLRKLQRLFELHLQRG